MIDLIENFNPVPQVLFTGLFTWAVTAAAGTILGICNYDDSRCSLRLIICKTKI
jgi:hypothetical protein